jgi:hypothetical protein
MGAEEEGREGPGPGERVSPERELVVGLRKSPMQDDALLKLT